MFGLTLVDDEGLHAFFGSVGAAQTLDGSLQNLLLFGDPQTQRLDLLTHRLLLRGHIQLSSFTLTLHLIFRAQ